MSATSDLDSRHRRWKLSPALLVIGITMFVSLFSWLVLKRHDVFLSHAFDLGQMSQALWKIRHGYGDLSTITGVSILGDHARLIMYPLALLPSQPEFLLVLQVVVISLGAVPLFLLARRHLPDVVALAIAGLYLAYPSLQWMLLFDFHPETFATTFLLWGLWALENKRIWIYWPSIGLAMICREDVAVAVGIIAAMLLLERRIRLGLITAGASFFALVTGLVVMSMNGTHEGSIFTDRYGWIGADPLQAATNLLLHPVSTLKGQGLGVAALLMLAGYVAPMVLVLFARPSRIWMPFPFMLLHLFSSLDQQRSIYFHYGFLIIPLLFFAAADGGARLWRTRPLHRSIGFAFVTLAFLGASLHTSPFTDRGYRGSEGWSRPAKITRQLVLTHPEGYVEEAREAISFIEDDASVSAAATLVPHLWDRPELFMIPNPFYPAWFGKNLFKSPDESVVPLMPEDPPRWVLIDVAHRGPESDELRQMLVDRLPDRYTAVYKGAWITVWELDGSA